MTFQIKIYEQIFKIYHHFPSSSTERSYLRTPRSDFHQTWSKRVKVNYMTIDEAQMTKLFKTNHFTE